MPTRKDRFTHVGPPAEVSPESPASSQSSSETDAPSEPKGSFEADYKDTVQLNVNVSPALRKAIRLKALEEDVPVTVALRRVLQAWVDGK